MNLNGHRSLVEKLGAYALGGLGDDERAEVEAHLDDCPSCRAELENILPVAALLPKADPGRLEESLLQGPPPGLDRRVFERIKQECWREAHRRPASIGWIAAAAIVLVVFTLSTFFLAEGRGEQVSLRPVSERMELSTALQNCEATATLEGERYSTQIELETRGLIPGQIYTVWLENADGTRAPAGGFQAFDEGPITVHLSAALPPGEAVALGLGTPEDGTGLRADLQGGVDADLIVPDLRGRTLEDAIEAAGPDFEIDAPGDDGGQPKETVVNQDPGPGNRARKGSTVSVTLSTDRQTLEEPEGTSPDSGSSKVKSTETESPETESPETESSETESFSGEPDSRTYADTANGAASASYASSESNTSSASGTLPAGSVITASGTVPAGEAAGQDSPAGTGVTPGTVANATGGLGSEPSAVGTSEIEAEEASVTTLGVPPDLDGDAGEGAGSADGPTPIVTQPRTEPEAGLSSPEVSPAPGEAPGVAPLPEPLPDLLEPLPEAIPLPEVAPLPEDLFPSVPPAPLLEEGQQPALPTLPEVSTVPDSLQQPVRDTLPGPLRDPISPVRPDILRNPTPVKMPDDDPLGDGDPTKGVLDIGNGRKKDRPGVDLKKKDVPRVDLPKKGVPGVGGRGPKLPALPR